MPSLNQQNTVPKVGCQWGELESKSNVAGE